MNIQRNLSFFATIVLTVTATCNDVNSQMTSNWTGSGGNANFFNVGNWDNGVPGSQDEAVFGFSGPFTVNMDNNAFIKTFSHPIGTMTLTGGNALNVGATPTLNSFLIAVNPGTEFNLQTDLQIGVGELGGLTLLGGADSNVAGFARIGFDAGIEGRLTLNGSGTTFTSEGLTIGESGEGNLIVQNGGVITSVFGRVGQNSASSGVATVSGAGSEWNSDEFIVVGGIAGTGILNIQNGGKVTSDSNGFIGTSAAATGTINVTGVNSELDVASFFSIGNDGQGTLNVTGGGLVGANLFRIARRTTSNGVVNIGNGGQVDANTILVGREGDATMNVTDGGDAICNVALIGELAAGIGEVIVTGNGSSWNINQFISVGDAGGTGTLNIENGGAVTSSLDGFIGAASTATGTVNVLDEGSELEVLGFFNVGNEGQGILNVVDGGLVGAGTLRVGRRPGSHGIVNVGSDAFVSAGVISIGREGEGGLSVTDGGIFDCNTAILGEFGTGDGTLVVDGVSSFNCLALDVGIGGIGTVIVLNGADINVIGNAAVGANSRIKMGDSLLPGFAGQLNVAGTLDIAGELELVTDTNVSGNLNLMNNGSIVVSANDGNILDDMTGLGGTILINSSAKLNCIGDFAGDAQFIGTGKAVFYQCLEPGNGASALSFDGDVRMQSTATTKIEIGGTNPGTTYDQLLVGGDVELGGALSVSAINGFQPTPNQQFTIIEIDDNRFGVFAGIAQGSVVASIGDVDLELDYFGGDGNDITLVAVGNIVLFGDINLDGVVNLLDVGPFVDLVANNIFQAEADINQDGVVNLLDVGPFVALLSGG